MALTAPAKGDSIETLYVDIAARADQLVTEAQQAVNEVIHALGAIDKKAQETEGRFSSLGRHIKQAMTIATGISFANFGAQLITRVVGLGKALISTNAQMQTFERSFETMTGSAEEAGEIIEWVKEQAKLTPFDVPGLISASQQLMTWGLDLKEWFTIVGDTAAAMNRPLSQVVNAIGTLATGQTGEAVRRFRDLGINLREFTDVLEFDARGALVTPLEEVIPIVKQIMEDKFGGMMESQSKTWSGVMSNMGDTWQQVIQVMGEPLFDELNAQLFSLYEWVDSNAENIENLAKNLGMALGGVLDLITAVTGRFSDLFSVVDALLTRVAGEEWFNRGIKAGQQVAGIVGGATRGAFDLYGGLMAGEGLEEAAMGGLEAWRETALAIGDAETQVEDLTVTTKDLTAAQLAGVETVRKLGDTYADMSDAAIVEIGEATTAFQAFLAELEETGVVTEQASGAVVGMLAGIEELEVTTEHAAGAIVGMLAGVTDLTDAYREGVTVYQETEARLNALREAMAAVRAEQEANLALAGKVAGKLGDRLQAAVEKYQESLDAAAKGTAAAIAEIEAKAAAAESAALTKHQEETAKLRDEFSREQMRRRRQFNVDWARLIREQNQEVLDAEWEYQFAKENLLIEGDEIALAELEARYKHEKEVRSREQGDARGDMQQQFDAENRDRQDQFDTQLRALQARLDQEIENIRLRAEEEVLAKEEALAEKQAKEDAALEERLQKIGEMQAQEVGDNQTVTQMLLEMWRQLYGDQIAAAIAAGIVQRQELEAIRQQALATASALANVRLPGGSQYTRPGPGRAVGGYSPPAVQQVEMHPNEFVLNPATTTVMERATGGRLTQGTFREIAEQRRIVDVNLQGTGLPADIINEMRQSLDDLVSAMQEDVGGF